MLVALPVGIGTIIFSLIFCVFFLIPFTFLFFFQPSYFGEFSGIAVRGSRRLAFTLFVICFVSICFVCEKGSFDMQYIQVGFLYVNLKVVLIALLYSTTGVVYGTVSKCVIV